MRKRVHIVNFNDLESVERLLKTGRIACVLTEPVLQNIGVVLPREGYLRGLIELCERYGALSVFDEIKTGFRCGLGGYQGIAGVRPDLSVFGKAIANGYPLSVIGGRANILRLFDDPSPQQARADRGHVQRAPDGLRSGHRHALDAARAADLRDDPPAQPDALRRSARNILGSGHHPYAGAQ